MVPSVVSAAKSGAVSLMRGMRDVSAGVKVAVLMVTLLLKFVFLRTCPGLLASAACNSPGQKKDKTHPRRAEWVQNLQLPTRRRASTTALHGANSHGDRIRRARWGRQTVFGSSSWIKSPRRRFGETRHQPRKSGAQRLKTLPLHVYLLNPTCYDRPFPPSRFCSV